MKLRNNLKYSTFAFLAMASLWPQPLSADAPVFIDKKIRSEAPKLEVPKPQISATVPVEIEVAKDLPAQKEIHAWVNIGARTDGPTPTPDETGYSDPLPFSLTPLKPIPGVIWDAYQDTTEYLGDAWSRFGAGIEPGAGDAFQAFWDGRLNASVLAKWKNGQDIIAPPHYTWTVLPPSSQFYLTEGSSGPETAVRTLAPSTQNKELRFDFGQIDAQSLETFPRSTVLSAFINKQGEENGAPLGPLSVKVNWHMRPVTMYRLQIEFDIFDDGSPTDISQLIFESAKSHVEVKNTGYQLANAAINALYIEPGTDMLVGPLLVGGARGAGSLIKGAAKIGGKVAGDMRVRRAAQLGHNRVSVLWKAKVETVNHLGTVTKSAAVADGAAGNAAVADTAADAAVAASAANEAATGSQQLATRVQDMQQSLAAAGKNTEAEAVGRKLTDIGVLRDESLQAAEYAGLRSTDVNVASTLHASRNNDIGTSDPDASFASLLEGLKAPSLSTANAAADIGRATHIAADNSRVVANIAGEVATIGDQAGQAAKANDIKDLATAVKAAGDAGVETASALRTTAGHLKDKNADKLEDSGFAKSEPQCFVAGTLITMDDGSQKPIEEIRPDDRVLSRNAITFETTPQRVAAVKSSLAENLIELRLENGDQITTTEEHPFYVEGIGFRPAKEIGLGSTLLTRAGPVVLISMSLQNRSSRVYNIEVAKFHSYFVGEVGVWVHNWCALPGGGQLLWKEKVQKIDGYDDRLEIFPVPNDNKPITDLDEIRKLDDVTWVIERKSATDAADGRTGIQTQERIDAFVKTQITEKLDKMWRALWSGSPSLPAYLSDPQKILTGETRIGFHFHTGEMDPDLKKAVQLGFDEWEANKNKEGFNIVVGVKWGEF